MKYDFEENLSFLEDLQKKLYLKMRESHFNIEDT